MRRIAVVTFSRAEYGLVKWLLADIADHERLELQLIVTGTHLEESYGLTISEIRADGFEPVLELPLGISGDGPTEIASWLGRAVAGLTEALASLRSDVLVITGDRFEMLGAAQAAMLASVPVAHIHGGEVTVGAIDDGVRHALTKLAHIHFPATTEYGRRLIQLGEDPAAIHVVGAPGLCDLTRGTLLDRTAIESHLGLQESEPYLLITYQPVTAEPRQSQAGLEGLLKALGEVPEFQMIFTGVNADPGSAYVGESIARFVSASAGRARFFQSLGHDRYLSALKFASACVGNSSSGIIEAPALGVPTVNIGDRQLGRVRATSIIDVGDDAASIAAAIRQVTAPDFMNGMDITELPYGRGGASRRVAETLGRISLDGILSKRFVDCGSYCSSWRYLTTVTSHV